MPPRHDDMPNTVLGRFLSLEMLGMLVVIGISWGTVTGKVAGLERQYDKTQEIQVEVDREQGQEVRALRGEVSSINRKLDVMGNNQEHFKGQIDKLDDRIDLILNLLEKQTKNGRD